ncbi:hypothetical protein RF11_06072 [Thelohanellus kitauei]|uniref:Uncharacterized protein n=1 Tax=Thelohanellus kitauei TaxID=669202 RepID=A0A0C2MTM3_THEKT|nr:hypothetical protein RF11_06072 [Thelohanellus kitauei]
MLEVIQALSRTKSLFTARTLVHLVDANRIATNWIHTPDGGHCTKETGLQKPLVLVTILDRVGDGAYKTRNDNIPPLLSKSAIAREILSKKYDVFKEYEKKKDY